MRLVWLPMLFLGACGSPVPPEAMAQISDDLAAVGHPFGRFQGVDVVDWKRGRPEEHERYADVAVSYVRGLRPDPNTMLVRVYQESIEPCRISIDVLSDDGPDPFLLDNKVASGMIGKQLCRVIEAD